MVAPREAGRMPVPRGPDAGGIVLQQLTTGQEGFRRYLERETRNKSRREPTEGAPLPRRTCGAIHAAFRQPPVSPAGPPEKKKNTRPPISGKFSGAP